MRGPPLLILINLILKSLIPDFSSDSLLILVYQIKSYVSHDNILQVCINLQE